MIDLDILILFGFCGFMSCLYFSVILASQNNSGEGVENFLYLPHIHSYMHSLYHGQQLAETCSICQMLYTQDASSSPRGQSPC